LRLLPTYLTAFYRAIADFRIFLTLAQSSYRALLM